MIVQPAWRKHLDDYIVGTVVEPIHDIATETGTKCSYQNLTISHDCSKAAFLSKGEIQVIDFKTKQIVQQISTGSPYLFCFHPSKPHIIAATETENIIEIDISEEHPRVVQTFKHSTEKCQHIYLTPFSEQLIITYVNGEIKGASLFDSSKITCQVFHENALSCVTSDDCNVLISASTDSIQFYDLLANQVVGVINQERNGTKVPIRISQNGSLVFVNKNEWIINVIDVQKKSVVSVIEDKKRSGIIDFHVSSDSKTILSISRDGSIIAFDTETAKSITSIKSERVVKPVSFALSNNDSFFSVIFEDGIIRSWDYIQQPKQILNTKLSEEESAVCGCLDKSGNHLIVGGSNHSITIIDLKNQKISAQLNNMHEKEIKFVSFDPKEEYVVSGSQDLTVHIFKIERDITQSITNLSILTTINIDDIPIEAIFMPQRVSKRRFTRVARIETIEASLALGEKQRMPKEYQNAKSGWQVIAFPTKEGKIFVYDFGIKSMKKIVSNSWWKYEDEAKNKLSITPDGSQILVGGTDGAIHFLDTETFAEDQNLKLSNQHSTFISAITLSPEGDLLVTGSKDLEIKVTDLHTRQCYSLSYHNESSAIQQLYLTNDRRFVVCASKRNVSFYHLLRKKLVHSIDYNCDINGIELSSDGSSLMTCLANKQIKYESFPFLNQIQIIDFSLDTPYRTMSTLPAYKLRKLWTSQIELTTEVIDDYNQLYIAPYQINLWYIFFLTQKVRDPASFVNQMIDDDIPIYNDMDEKNIIYYLLKSNEQAAINTIFQRSNETLRNNQDVFDCLSGIFNEIMASKVPGLHQFLEECIEQPELLQSAPPPRFGELVASSNFVLSEDKKLTKDIQEKLIKEGSTPVHFTATKIRIDSRYSSDQNLRLLESIFINTNLEIFKTQFITRLIDWYWRKSSIISYVLFGLNIIFFIAFSLFALFKELESGAYEIFILLLNTVFFIYEVLQMMGSFKSYFQGVWNIIDIMRISFIYLFIIFQLGEIKSTEDEIMKAFLSFSVFFTYLKMVSFFRIFTATRKLIRMTMEVIKDMKSFFLIIVFVLFGFAFIFFRLEEGHNYSFETALLDMYQMMLGSFNITNYTQLEIVFFVIITLFMMIVLLNLLISIIGDTYGKVQSESILNDSLEKVDQIIETVIFRRVVRKIFSVCKKRNHKEVDPQYQESYKRYIFWVTDENAEEEEEDLQFRLFKKEIRKQFKKMSHDSHKGMKSFSENISRDLISNDSNLQEKVSQLSKSLLSIERKLNLK